MQYQRGFFAVLSAAWLLALLSFLGPTVLSSLAELVGWEHPGASWLFVPLAGWIGFCVAGMVFYRKHAGWLLLSAPMAFFTPILAGVAMFGCMGHRTCP